LLPNTGRRPIPPPKGLPDRRPPVVVGYNLTPDQLEPNRLPYLPQAEHTQTFTLDEGRSLGQSFVTLFDYDLLNAVAVVIPPDPALPADRYERIDGYELVVYHDVRRRRVLARTTDARKEKGTDGTCLISFTFEPAPRLKYNRGSVPYLLELTWRRPPGTDDPAPTFCFADANAYAGGEMYVDGERRPRCDLAFSVRGTHTDVSRYELALGLWLPGDKGPWPSYFVAVREDVFNEVVLSQERAASEEEARRVFFERLNKVLIEL